VATNVNAAGLCQFSSPGSEGNVNPPHNLRCPGHVPPPWWNPENTGSGTLAGIVAVGATDASDVIASFSSRGPVTWQEVAPFNDYVYPPGLTKPELAAPGVEVKTTLLGGGYTIVSGTSWSTALAAGAAAVLLSFDPSMSPAQVDEVLELSAVDLGSPGKDCVYGAGRIDLLRAVTGIGDHSAPALGSQRLEVWPSPFRTACQVSGVGPVLVLDAFGRRIASLSSGRWKPETGIRPGVYFLKGPGGQAVRVSCVR
jgi:subtilisin family serine protease